MPLFAFGLLVEALHVLSLTKVDNQVKPLIFHTLEK
jgi:hypothetical protein